jgi:hypothetical protein
VRPLLRPFHHQEPSHTYYSYCLSIHIQAHIYIVKPILEGTRLVPSSLSVSVSRLPSLHRSSRSSRISLHTIPLIRTQTQALLISQSSPLPLSPVLRPGRVSTCSQHGTDQPQTNVAPCFICEYSYRSPFQFFVKYKGGQTLSIHVYIRVVDCSSISCVKSAERRGGEGDAQATPQTARFTTDPLHQLPSPNFFVTRKQLIMYCVVNRR